MKLTSDDIRKIRTWAGKMAGFDVARMVLQLCDEREAASPQPAPVKLVADKDTILSPPTAIYVDTDSAQSEPQPAAPKCPKCGGNDCSLRNSVDGWKVYCADCNFVERRVAERRKPFSTACKFSRSALFGSHANEKCADERTGRDRRSASVQQPAQYVGDGAAVVVNRAAEQSHAEGASKWMVGKYIPRDNSTQWWIGQMAAYAASRLRALRATIEQVVKSFDGYGEEGEPDRLWNLIEEALTHAND